MVRRIMVKALLACCLNIFSTQISFAADCSFLESSTRVWKRIWDGEKCYWQFLDGNIITRGQCGTASGEPIAYELSRNKGYIDIVFERAVLYVKDCSIRGNVLTVESIGSFHEARLVRRPRRD